MLRPSRWGMRFDLLIDRLSASIAGERTMLRRVARYVLPLVLLPLGPAVAQIPTGWLGLFAGGLVTMIMLIQAELFIRPSFERARVVDHDLTSYLGVRPAGGPRSRAGAVPLIAPAALALALGVALFVPAMLAAADTWQRLAALALAAGGLWTVWSRLSETLALIDSVAERLDHARTELTSHREHRAHREEGRVHQPAGPAARPPPVTSVAKIPTDGLLVPELARRAAGLPLPPLRLSPAAVALLRTTAYLTLRDEPETEDRALIEALAELGRWAFLQELNDGAMPPVGGKIYLPVAASGAVAALLGATMRRLAMDGAYSGSLHTWLVRLPPARSYAVAGRLVDAVVALGILPHGVLPHHLTVQGDLGPDARVLSIVHLAAMPAVLEERPGRGGDERPFIMRGGGVLDDMDGRGRLSGPRTDFIDGFLFVGDDAAGAEHLTGHTLNLRVKQVLAYGLATASIPSYRRTPAQERVAESFGRLREGLRELLARHGLERALEANWFEGAWSEIWPLIAGMGQAKQRDPAFIDAAQQLRDTALAEIEGLAEAEARGGR